MQFQVIIKALGIFNNVFFKKTKYIVQKKNSAAKRINEVMNMTFGLKNFKDICNIRYDKMLFYNIDEVTYILYSMMSKNNPDLICERFEEGILSYNNSFPSSDKMKIARLLRKLLHKRNLLEQILHFYCFTPAVYEGKLGTLIIPPIESINDSSVTQFLSLFAVNNVSSCYKQKYIYFSSVYDFEGGEPIGELDLVKKIAEKVKNENLIVKVHPRDNPQRFIECGLNVDLNSQIPWEVVQFKQDFSQHIFLTVNSGSVLGVNMIISDMPRTYFLFPLCDLDKLSAAFFYDFRRSTCNNYRNNATWNGNIMYSTAILNIKRLHHFAMGTHIYQSLNDILATDPNYLHQRAKCYIRSAYKSTEEKDKEKWLEMAYRDASISNSSFEKRYESHENEKIMISAAHSLYTAALALCHIAKLRNYRDISINANAVKCLYKAISSPFNSIEFVNNDATYNYNNVVGDLVSTFATDVKYLKDKDAEEKVAELLMMMISNNTEQ